MGMVEYLSVVGLEFLCVWVFLVLDVVVELCMCF